MARKPTGRPRGRPEHKPSAKQIVQVETCAAVGVPHTEISQMIGVSLPTLLKCYENALQLGKAKVIADLGGKLVKMGKRGNLGAICFYMKCQAGWRDHGEAETANALNKLAATLAQTWAEAVKSRSA